MLKRIARYVVRKSASKVLVAAITGGRYQTKQTYPDGHVEETEAIGALGIAGMLLRRAMDLWIVANNKDKIEKQINERLGKDETDGVKLEGGGHGSVLLSFLVPESIKATEFDKAATHLVVSWLGAEIQLEAVSFHNQKETLADHKLDPFPVRQNLTLCRAASTGLPSLAE
jgi:hypothetical protein